MARWVAAVVTAAHHSITLRFGSSRNSRSGLHVALGLAELRGECDNPGMNKRPSKAAKAKKKRPAKAPRAVASGKAKKPPAQQDPRLEFVRLTMKIGVQEARRLLDSVEDEQIRLLGR
jgi:hypothetical protein